MGTSLFSNASDTPPPTGGFLTDDWGCTRYPDRRDLQPRALSFQTYTILDLTIAVCTITTTHVEAQVSCTGQTCAVVRIRHSRQPHPPPAWT